MRNPCVAHRGWSGRAPENTLASLRLAMAEPSISWIEIDIHLAKDNVPVLIHDYSLRRTTNSRGKVRLWSAAELASLDAGSWFSPYCREEHIPTLDEALRLTRGRCRLNIELKTDGSCYPEIEARVLERIKAFHVVTEVVITSFHVGTLQRVKELVPTIRTGLIIDGWRNSLVQELQLLGSDFLSINHVHLKQERVDRLRAAGIDIMAWTINDVSSIKKIANMDSNIMICTNYPDRWREAMTQLAH